MAIIFSRKTRKSPWTKPSQEARISWMELDPNHKRGDAGVRFARYHGAETVQAYLNRGGTWADLKYDIEHHHLGIIKPATSPVVAAEQVSPATTLLNPNKMVTAHSGIYIVTLNNAEWLSTQAHDRRYDGKAVLRVNRENRKFGSAIHLTERMEHGYYQTFGQHNVNFIPVVATQHYQALEQRLKDKFYTWRLRSPAGVLTEWTQGIDTNAMIAVILATALELGIDHRVLKRSVE